MPGSPWSLGGAELVDTVCVVTLGWSREDASMRWLRADPYALIGAIAESVSSFHQRVEAESIHYDVVTGMLADDGLFQSHGHLVQLRICGTALPATCAGARTWP